MKILSWTIYFIWGFGQFAIRYSLGSLSRNAVWLLRLLISHIKCIMMNHHWWFKLRKAIRHQSDSKSSGETTLCVPIFNSPSQCSQKLGSNEKYSIRNPCRIQKRNFRILYIWMALFSLGYNNSFAVASRQNQSVTNKSLINICFGSFRPLWTSTRSQNGKFSQNSGFR